MGMRRLGLLLAFATACPRADAPPPSPTSAPAPSNLADDEEVRFVPTFAAADDDGWNVPIDAWVFEPEDDGLARRALVKVVEEALETQLDDVASDRLAANLQPFLVDNERGKDVVVTVGGVTQKVCTSGANGRCSGVVRLPATARGTVEVTLVLGEDDPRRFVGRAHLLEDAGVSVLSDIDDTIKITEVHDRAKLVENTFVRPFRATPGVVALYRRWSEQGAAFHYVSNSPVPLMDALEHFLDGAGYPPGSLTLKMFRWTDGTFLDLLAAPEDHKQRAIEAHLDAFTTRRFVLVGDTGERDPEIYAALRRTYGERIAKIYLRDTGSMPADALRTRLEAVFEGLPAQSWTVFEDGAEIHDDLPR
jgi:phosphatidate phosphatase APP1